MNWATHAIEVLRRGETTRLRPRGHSMKGKIGDGALVTLAPCDPAALQAGDVVLVRVHGRVYLHLIAVSALPNEPTARSELHNLLLRPREADACDDVV
jgi:hypothetical protein